MLRCLLVLMLGTTLTAATTIDLLVVTSQELGQQQSLDSIRGVAADQVAWMNAALERSDIPAHIRLVGCARSMVRETNESDGLITIISRTQADAGVTALRNRLGADLVSCWVSQVTDAAGRGQRPGAYTALDFRRIEGDLLAHELGHNLGGRHDDGTGGTIMSPFNNGSNGYYSNTNAATIRRHVATAAAYRQAIDHPALALILPASMQAGNELDLPLRWSGPVERIAHAEVRLDALHGDAFTNDLDALQWIPLQGGSYHADIVMTTVDHGQWTTRQTLPVAARPGALGPWQRSMLAADLQDSAIEARSGDGIRLKASISVPNLHVGPTEDHGHFLYVPFSGDGDIVARLPEEITESGVMMRQDLDGESPRISASVSFAPSLAVRPTRAARATEVARGPSISFGEPIWWRLRREGSTFSAWTRSDGQAWQYIGETEVDLPAEILVGVFGATGLDDNGFEAPEFTLIRVNNVDGQMLYQMPDLSGPRRRIRIQVDRSADWRCWAASGTFPTATGPDAWQQLFAQDSHILRADQMPFLHN